eukprot:TRINITY_DN2197_c1_g1_i1.p1 TRINITY_DN2197_c1_g1~~TRINITY_DN2197_c1_g1_i1.p1  ORF type:complete len:108 (-),score=16.48 TRINITY_DN2197_c1_g1_i1:79-402(-)
MRSLGKALKGLKDINEGIVFHEKQLSLEAGFEEFLLAHSISGSCQSSRMTPFLIKWNRKLFCKFGPNMKELKGFCKLYNRNVSISLISKCPVLLLVFSGSHLNEQAQ